MVIKKNLSEPEVMQRCAFETMSSFLAWSGIVVFIALALSCLPAQGSEGQAAAHFRKDVQPILSQYCYDCHGDGAKKGNVTLDEFKSDEALLGNHDLWFAVLKNLRAGLMPPEKKPHPSNEERRRFEEWIKFEAFGIDPKNPDPGRVTIRRLNRVEYRNTIRDLMGIDFKADEEFPPDDTGYGFDNIGDVLTVSPLLLEKYMQAAEAIVVSAVPIVSKVVQEKHIPGTEFRGGKGSTNGGDRLTFYQAAKVSHVHKVEQTGEYRLLVELEVLGQFDFDPGRCTVAFEVGDRELKKEEFGWQNNKRFRFEFAEKLPAGEYPLAFELQPLTPLEKKVNSLDLRIVSVKIQGPLDERLWVRPKNFDLFFSKDVPKTNTQRRRYAREVLSRFATKAFRRPVDDKIVDRLLAIAEGVYRQRGKKFEEGVAQAMVAVLASPRFLFRVEETEVATGVPPGVEPGVSIGKVGMRSEKDWEQGKPGSGGRMQSSTGGGAPTATVPRKAPPHPYVDEYALAARLSYFLWSTMPDEELFRLAARGELRKNLNAQAKRMLDNSKSEALIQNFTGQWLQVRDVEGIDINARVVLARDSGQEKELKRDAEEFRARLANVQTQTNRMAQTNQARPFNRPRFARPAVELDGPLRKAMRLETEMFFAHIVREDRSVLEFIDSDYTFLNEKLAKHYGLTNVIGNEMRRVTLPKDSPRGGLLTHGSVLVVTSNPTRTSPVKRGLFLLENIVGTPPPPPPANIPDLEESEKEFKDREPTLREVLELHRSKPLCSSCHSRMDPLGLALENFNALGMWREKERGQQIDTVGKLITGEPFQNIQDVKRILTHERQQDFYRCLTEKLLTYALGRGLEYYDVETVDQIVARLERENGRFSALLMGVIESAPFQKRRNVTSVATGVSTAVEPGVSPGETFVRSRSAL